MARLEVCVSCPDSLIGAIEGGADRIELCSAIEVAGITPTPGLVMMAKTAGIPVHALIRPRGGVFVWSRAEVEVMKAEIAFMRDNGLEGVVIGAARPDNTLDEDVLAELMAAATGLEVSLHRVFDCTPDLDAALDTAIRLGIKRVLTSGGTMMVSDGIETLARLHARAGDRIEIMAGAGLSIANAPYLLRRVPFEWVHASATEVVGGPLDPHLVALGFASRPRRVTTAAKVRALRAVLQ